ncbi:hypothetical protein PC110_g23354 [Phytophthora cactorum]|uniref:Uncharacterized protein n=1 Tax=Phytophthora cactorum TaxID=29920 RepID=A0A329R6G8_9STRA|nr:hypothetical protein PC110_g23354 [Phytophthora cactorum]
MMTCLWGIAAHSNRRRELLRRKMNYLSHEQMKNYCATKNGYVLHVKREKERDTTRPRWTTNGEGSLQVVQIDARQHSGDAGKCYDAQVSVVVDTAPAEVGVAPVEVDVAPAEANKPKLDAWEVSRVDVVVAAADEVPDADPCEAS